MLGSNEKQSKTAWRLLNSVASIGGWNEQGRARYIVSGRRCQFAKSFPANLKRGTLSRVRSNESASVIGIEIPKQIIAQR
jgi:hypothetical protein